MDRMRYLYMQMCKFVRQGGWIWKLLSFIYIIKSDKKCNKLKLLKKNKSLKNIHKGERCFVLGNGPSLNNLDFSLLENEQVFTVNCLMVDERYKLLKPNYHFWMDYNGFGLRDDVKGDASKSAELMKMLEDYENLLFFVPAQAYPVIRQYGVDQNIDMRYLDMIDYGHIHKIDISTVSLGFSTVVQYAIETAIYMGFKEIYLLGCDTTIIKSVIDVALGQEVSTVHAYQEDEEKSQEDAYKQVLKNNGVKFVLEDTLSVIKGYEELDRYCDKNDIKLVNLSDITLIDCIKRDRIENVLKQ
ncbi:MAG: hypothetical protein Q4D51_08850 [Eubacteriales bacterium]|nr:hypothetical protein [Eubacteriales bacterium]